MPKNPSKIRPRISSGIPPENSSRIPREVLSKNSQKKSCHNCFKSLSRKFCVSSSRDSSRSFLDFFPRSPPWIHIYIYPGGIPDRIPGRILEGISTKVPEGISGGILEENPDGISVKSRMEYLAKPKKEFIKIH